MKDGRVLVFPRAIFSEAFSLLPWDAVQPQLSAIEDSFLWLERALAERSTDLVQAIPCAYFSDSEERYCVLRRVEDVRTDLNKRLSLVVGGHVDESPLDFSFQFAMKLTLEREVKEELGFVAKENPEPVGVIVDNSSIQASRHVAFVHKVVAERVTPQAPEEFNRRSKLTGEFWGAAELVKRRSEFDPWSRLLIEERVGPGLATPSRRQWSFL